MRNKSFMILKVIMNRLIKEYFNHKSQRISLVKKIFDKFSFLMKELSISRHVSFTGFYTRNLTMKICLMLAVWVC